MISLLNTISYQKEREEYRRRLDKAVDMSDMVEMWVRHPLCFMEFELGMDLTDRWQVDFWRLYCDLSVGERIIVLKAATSVGKTAAMSGALIWSMVALKKPEWGLKGLCASIDEQNLMKNFWQEIGKHVENSVFVKKYFDWKKPYILRPKDEDEQGNWFISPKTLSKSAAGEMMGESVRGIHSDITLGFFDEAQSIPIAAGQKIHGIFTAGNLKFGRVVLSGNPSTKLGALYDFFKSGMADVINIHGDPRLADCSSRVNKKHNQKLIDTYGDDSFIVRTTVRSLFPLQEMNALINGEAIQRAVLRSLSPAEYGSADIRMGVDVARGTEGGDKSVIVVRQGRKVLHIEKHQTLDEEMLAGRVKAVKATFGTSKEFVDCTGGYGDTTLRVLRRLGVNTAIGVGFGNNASNPVAYANRRAEMWWRVKELIEGKDEKGMHNGLDIPDDSDLIQELETMLYSHDKKDRILMFSKDLMRQHIGRSTDTADGLCLTCAEVDGINTGSLPHRHKRRRRGYKSKFDNKERSGRLKDERRRRYRRTA